MAEIYTAPSDLVAVGSSATTIGLTWSVGESSVQTEIQRKPSGGVYQTLGSISAGTSAYSDTTCASNTLYYYRIRHNDGEDTSAWATAASSYTYPGTPTGLAVSWSGKTATLTWTNGSTYTYVKTYYKLSSEPTTWTTDTETLSGTATTRDITVATENASYDFRVRGYNSTSTLNSAYATVTDESSGVIAPTGLEGISGGANSVALSWTDNSSVEDGYEVYYKLSSASSYTLFETTAADATTSTVTGLTGDVSYDFRVRAKDGSTYSGYATLDGLYVVTPPAGTPGTPTATVTGQTTITLTWTDTATGLTRMYVYYSTDGSSYSALPASTPGGVAYVANGIETYAVTGLTSNTTYYFKLRAWNTGGWSASYSDASSVVTTTADLDPPTGVYAEAVSSTQIKLTWTSNAADATHHCVERKSSGGSYGAATEVAAGTDELTVGSLTAGTEYTFRIRAKLSTTYGDYSTPVTKTITALGTAALDRNEVYIGLGSVVGVASSVPKSSLTCSWRSKPLDFSDQDPACYNKIKTVKKVQLEFIDDYSSVPVTTYVSVDDGEHWNSCSRYIGEGEGKSKTADFFIEPLTGLYFTVKVSSTSSITSFTWTAIQLAYVIGGEYVENDLSRVSGNDDFVVYERGTVDGGTATSSYLDEDTYSGGDA